MTGRDWLRGLAGATAANANMVVARLRPMPALRTPDLSGKQAIVTGANRGIGFEVALGLARRQCRIVMVCRDANKAEAAAQKIREQTGNDKVETMVADLGSFDSVKSFVDMWRKREHSRIDVLINNAGTSLEQKTTTADGFDLTYQANFLSPFFCTLSLLDCFAPDARIVQSSSITVYISAVLEPGDGNSSDLLGGKKDGDPLAALSECFQLYARTKAQLAMFSSELQERLLQSGRTKGIFVAAAHPGVVKTDIWSKSFSIMPPIRSFVNLVGISPSDGADTILWLACDPSASVDPSNRGAYFDRRCKRWLPGWMLDRERVHALWASWVSDSPFEKDPLPFDGP